MNREHLPPDDELASAYLDGELDAEAAALVEGDPDRMAEVAQLRELRAHVAGLANPPVDPARREEALRVALAAMDGTVVPLAPVAGRGRRRLRWVLPAAGVAAAVVVVGLAVAVVHRSSGGTDTASRAEATTAAPATTAGGLAPEDRQAASAAAGSDGAATTVVAAATGAAPLAPGPSGGANAKLAPASPADLAALTAAASAARGAAPPPTAGRCPPPAPAAAFAGPLPWSTGQAVELYLDRSATPPTAWAVAVDGCQVLAVVTLA